MTDTYLDTKVTCTKCGATFNMRLDADSPFKCDKCDKWQQAKFPCPLCKGKTTLYSREGNSWVPLADPKHDHEPEEEPEPEPEPVAAESAPKAEPKPEPPPEPEPEPESEEHPE